MSEAEWLACADPAAVLRELEWRCNAEEVVLYRSHRKLRLFAVACCRAVWSRLTDERSRRAVAVAERDAHGLATKNERQRAIMALRSNEEPDETYPALDGFFVAAWTCNQEKQLIENAPHYLARLVRLGLQPAAQAALLRDIFGSPYRPAIPVRRSVGWFRWNDGLVPRLAREIYDGRLWGKMPLLADALLDAGCEEEELIQHCQSEGPHVRGCWAVDLILGKS
jgi:hypothetical protein